MQNDSYNVMTPFDQYISTQSLQMTKLMIPFLPPNTQRMMAIYVKFFELRHTFSFFQDMRQHHSSTDDILNTLKPYMNSSDVESFEQMMNMMHMMNMMKEMSDVPFNPSEMMMGMFTQDNHNETQEEGELNVGLDEGSQTSEYGSAQVRID